MILTYFNSQKISTPLVPEVRLGLVQLTTTNYTLLQGQYPTSVLVKVSALVRSTFVVASPATT